MNHPKKQTPHTPTCKHALPATLRIVQKDGPNKGRQFWTCSRPIPCQFFLWESLSAKTPSVKDQSRPERTHTRASHPTASPSQSPSSWGDSSPSMTPTTPSVTSQNIAAANSAQTRMQSQQSPSRWSSPQRNSLQSMNSMTVEAVLVSRKTFALTAPYHPRLTELFKTADGIFAKPTKRWVFDIAKYEQVSRLLAESRDPPVSFKELPRFIHQLLQHTSFQEREIDLSFLPEKMRHALKPFQEDGIKMAIRRQGRILLSDEMGLGKSVQAIGIACYFKHEWPVLVVCPSSLRFKWKKEFLDWCDNIAEDEIGIILSRSDEPTDKKVVITSYDMLLRTDRYFEENRFQIVVADESHYIKSTTAKRTNKIMPLLSRSRRAILLSGTPALSRPIELYPQLQSLFPNIFFNAKEFALRYCAAHEGPFGWDFTGSSNLEELNCLLSETLMIRRKKSEVLLELPPKERQKVLIDIALGEEYSRLMKEFSQTSMPDSTTFKGPLISRLYMMTGVAKVHYICQYLQDVLKEHQKVVLFAHHKEVMDMMGEKLQKQEISFVRIDGTTNAIARQDIVNQFKEVDSIRLALLSVTAAGTGLDFTRASIVLFAELHWTPGILAQAEDRAHRLGQQGAVQIKYLLGRKSLDEKIWPMIEHKLDVVSKAIDSETQQENFASTITSVTRRDLAHKDQSRISDFMKVGQSGDVQHSGKDQLDVAATLDVRVVSRPEPALKSLQQSLFGWIRSTPSRKLDSLFEGECNEPSDLKTMTPSTLKSSARDVVCENDNPEKKPRIVINQDSDDDAPIFMPREANKKQLHGEMNLSMATESVPRLEPEDEDTGFLLDLFAQGY